ncbi:transglycosylase SLT domain-containing protein [Luteimonas sp. R10]|uniref:lytic transglycosylase domain-containing protein n=1 Tax=Luteimonas sp. R10 TaxID=3108176 RepID=UPI00308CB749|nr:transglycosylase SLT domain-containing protein [Luteimonas sp. R10]
MTGPRLALWLSLAACGLWMPPSAAGAAEPATPTDPAAAPAAAEAAAPDPVAPDPVARNGSEIFATFRDGLSDPECTAEPSERWRRHFSHVPDDLAAEPDRLLPLFGYVVDALRASHLPTEYALIPFVESGYRPGARSPSGPAGLWQFIAVTARKHKIAIRPGYDGRLSPVDSTRAAVRYLRTLHGMFAGDWRLAVMGYNAGEYRVFGALKAAGQRAMDAEPEKLAVPRITQAYVRKLQALSCLLVEAGEREDWLRAIDRRVPVLTTATLPADATHLDPWARRHGYDVAQVRRFNPVFAEGRIARGDRGLRVLVPARADDPMVAAAETTTPATTAQPHVGEAERSGKAGSTELSGFVADASALVAENGPDAAPAPRTHVVARGESIWRIARRYGVGSARLLARNGLNAASVLQPGMILRIDDEPASRPTHDRPAPVAK